jgi:hypothetical protein
MLQKIASKYLEKVSYGGDMVGDGTSYYDHADFFSIDPEDIDIPEEDIQRTNSSMKDYATWLLKNDLGTLEDIPLTQVVLSKQRYNADENIEGRYWAKQVLKALKNRDREKIRDLAEYGFAWYGTDKAEDIPGNIRRAPKPNKHKLTLLERLFGVNTNDYVE